VIRWLEGLAEAIRGGARLAWSLAFGSYSSVRHNLGLALFSVAIAFVIWIFVTDAENPNVTGVVGESVPVIPVNVPEGLVAPETLGSVRVSVRAREGVLEELTAIDFEATADLSDYDAGEALAEVQVEVLERDDDVRVTGVSPGQVSVNLQAEARKTLTVTLDFTGDPPVGFDLAGEPVVSPREVEIVGTPELVARVTQVVAEVSLSGATADIEDLEARLTARASTGQQIAGVRIIPEEVSVDVDIEQDLFERDIEVAPVITGTPADGYRVTSVRVEPLSGDPPFNVVRAQGTLQVLDSVRQLTTEPIDISGARSDVVRTAAINPVPNLVLATTTVTVTVVIEPALGQQQFAVVPTLIGVGEGLTARIVNANVLVVLEGPLPALNSLEPGDIDTAIDVGGLLPGTHTLPVIVVSPSSALSVLQVTPGEVQVVVSEPIALPQGLPVEEPTAEPE
jgi:YbbR domain-containing protein